MIKQIKKFLFGKTKPTKIIKNDEIIREWECKGIINKMWKHPDIYFKKEILDEFHEKMLKLNQESNEYSNIKKVAINENSELKNNVRFGMFSWLIKKKLILNYH